MFVPSGVRLFSVYDLPAHLNLDLTDSNLKYLNSDVTAGL